MDNGSRDKYQCENNVSESTELVRPWGSEACYRDWSDALQARSKR